MSTSYTPFIQRILLPIGIIFLSTLILSTVHIHNGFPLILGDSKGYIERAHRLVETSHWSNTYAAFMAAIMKLTGSVQWIAVSQNLIISTLLYLLCKNIMPRFNGIKFLGIVLLMMATAMPWISSMLMSDLFTPICVLCISLILAKPLDRTSYITLLLILFVGFSAHQSHIIIMPLFIGFVVFALWLMKRLPSKKSLFTHLVILIILFAASNIFEKNIFNNRTTSSKYGITKSGEKVEMKDISTGYYFIVARIRESGQIQPIIDDYCEEGINNYLCAFANRDTFVKIRNVPFKDRNENNPQYIKYATDNKEFVLHSLTKPRFYYGLLSLSMRRGLNLLIKTRIRKYNTLRDSGNKQLIKLLDKINPNDASAYSTSRQINGFYRVFLRKATPIIEFIWWKILFPITLLLFIYLSIKDRQLISAHKEVMVVILFLILGHVINCMVCGTFSSDNNVRYSSRTIWLINLGIFLFYFTLYSAKLNRQRKQ